ncbi:MAG: CHAT domain-containing protein, partial [Ardenticatenaceae bacterium]
DVMLERVALLRARGQDDVALQTASRTLQLVAGSHWPVQQIYAHMAISDLTLPDYVQAEAHLLAAQRLANTVMLPHARYRLHQRLGHVRRLQGRDEEARELLQAATDEIERLRGTLAHEALRTSFLADKAGAYEELIQLHLAAGDEDGIQQAFTVAERAKSRALVDLLAGVGDVGSGVADAEMTARLRTIRTDLNAIYNQLLGHLSEYDRQEHSPELQTRASELEQEWSRLRLQIAATSVAEPDLWSPSPSLEAIQAHLPPFPLLAYHVVGDEIVAFVRVAERLLVARQISTPATIRQLLQRLEVQWARFRAGRTFVERHAETLERSVQRVLAALYTELFAPLESLLDEVLPARTPSPRRLAIVPHGLLHHVPFHALHDGRHYLLERYEVSYAPSATVLSLCQRRSRRRVGPALLFGVTDPAIPAVEREVYAVGRHVHDAEVWLNEEATSARLQSAAPGCSVLHMACHGLFRADNPMFSALKLHDGWLTAADALQLDLAGALVTLSACESGRGKVLGGDEILGLTRSFLGAGATTIVVSLWLAQDETTANLMAEWYRRLQQTSDRASALRAAQLAIKEHYPHPYYWAPFVLVGQR